MKTYSTMSWRMHKQGFELSHISPAMAVTLELLIKWKLPELCNTFIDQGINERALKYLTEKEICELIPRIGSRTVFRALLKKWRKEENMPETQESTQPQHKAIPTQKRTNPTALSASIQSNIDSRNETEATEAQTQNPSEIFGPQLCAKIEIDSDSDATDIFEAPSLLSSSHRNQQSLECVANEISMLENKRKPKRRKQKDVYFNVRELILNSPCGKKVFDFYEQHGHLDKHNRKRLVTALIFDAVNREIDMGADIYNNMKDQILSLFPNEKGETYYVPSRTGESQKGMLHYKYSNYMKGNEKHKD